MKRSINFILIALTTVLFSLSAWAAKPDKKGNGLPHVSMSDSWSLVIHSRPYDKCPTSGFDGTNRRSLVVASLDGWDGESNPHGNNLPDPSDFNDILLTANDSLDDFWVEDGNACDDDPAIVSLPNAVASNYDLFIKLIGKPDEATAASLCADLYLSDEWDGFYCNTGSVKVRSKGNNPYINVTDELLWLTNIDCDGTGDAYQTGDVPLFDSCLQDEFWDWSTTDKAKSIIIFVPKS